MKSARLFIYIIIGLFLTGPEQSGSETQVSPVTYVDSIIEDEEGGKLYFPSFIFAEPVRKEIYVIEDYHLIIL
jgi:hypothetical protein